MNVTIPGDLEASVERRLASGVYASASDVVRRALELLNSHEPLRDERKAAEAAVKLAALLAERPPVESPEFRRLPFKVLYRGLDVSRESLTMLDEIMVRLDTDDEDVALRAALERYLA
ncbi:MAG: type II toxin-antitoxin system ParD family antitoxin [Acidobacteria bacterium]|nr:type II toxin-antitoxin system ParD family antitoxin [Acidobacteriota bacterium]